MAVPGGEAREGRDYSLFIRLPVLYSLVLALSNGPRFPRTYASKAVCRHGHPCDSYEPVLNRQEWKREIRKKAGRAAVPEIPEIASSARAESQTLQKLRPVANRHANRFWSGPFAGKNHDDRRATRP